MIRCIGLFSFLPHYGMSFSVSEKKIISFRENFWPGKPSKTVISPILKSRKMPVKPYAARLSEVFKT
jgi:hypothetical protein